MSKITNDGLTRSGTGCFIAVATVGVKGLSIEPRRLIKIKHAENAAIQRHKMGPMCGRRRPTGTTCGSYNVRTRASL